MEKKKILVVDDEMDMRIFLKTLLETSGYSPVIMKNGKDGLRKAYEIIPDLIILDVMMPEEGGLQMFRHLRADEKMKQIPVIMLSGVSKEVYAHSLKMLSLQAEGGVPQPQAYLEKPPDPEVILDTVRQLLNPRRLG